MEALWFLSSRKKKNSPSHPPRNTGIPWQAWPVEKYQNGWPRLPGVSATKKTVVKLTISPHEEIPNKAVCQYIPSLKTYSKSSENRPGPTSSNFQPLIFQARSVSFRECISQNPPYHLRTFRKKIGQNLRCDWATVIFTPYQLPQL